MITKEKNNPFEWIKQKVNQVAQGICIELNRHDENTSDLDAFQSLLHQHLAHPTQPQTLTNEESVTLQWVREQTKAANQNNVTRTRAYEDFYHQYPEIHWAYLAHMVSRNGGWNMTDLKGDMLPRLLSNKETQEFFHLLERCNWLIFQDAFPQLLLYAESKRRQQALFHLLQHFNVSVFMVVAWKWFWRHRDSKILSYALIMNEQNYIESRVVQHPHYKENVLNQAEFKTQAFFHLNHVLFPFWDSKTKKVRLAGTIVEDFTDLKARIKVGKQLYALLFEVDEVAEGVREWSDHMIHSGSRADYWPHIFTKTRSNKPRESYSLHLEGKRLHPKASPLWSPILEEAWQDVVDPEPAGNIEWCYSEKAVDHLEKSEKPSPYDMTDEYYFALNKIEVVIVAKENLLK